MKCSDAAKGLSPLADDELGVTEAAQIVEHLGTCASCRSELDRLRVLRKALEGLPAVEVPPFLRHLVDLRIAARERSRWTACIRDALQYRWSRIRTTETSWYLIRALGTVVSFLFFFFISEMTGPQYFRPVPNDSQRQFLQPGYTYQVGQGVLRSLGYTQFDPNSRPNSRVEPGINDLYLLSFGESASKKVEEDSFSVVTVVDRSGAARIRSVIKYPADTELLSDFSSMLQSARCRPASQNGRTVDSRMILTFSQISVYD